MQKTYNKTLAALESARHRAIKETQELLARNGVDLLGDIHHADDVAKSGDKLYNLTWAFNGNGTHSTETIFAVRGILQRAEAAAGGNGALATRNIQQVLGEMGDVLQRGRKITDSTFSF